MTFSSSARGRPAVWWPRRLAAAGARVALVGAAARAGWEGLSRRSVALLAEEGSRTPQAGHHRWAVCAERRVGRPQGPRARSGWSSGVHSRTACAPARARPESMTGADTVTEPSVGGRQWRGLTRAGGDARGAAGDRRARASRARAARTVAAGGGTAIPSEARAPPKRRLSRARTSMRSILAGAGGRRGHDALWVQVVGRPRGAGEAADARSAWIAAAAAQIPALAQRARGCATDGELVAGPAHARLGLGVRREARDATRWRVGDAALALDPLSGQGVYEALRGARLVATAVQSVMRGGDAPPAHRFVAERQEESWISGVRAAAGFYRENAARGAVLVGDRSRVRTLAAERRTGRSAGRAARRTPSGALRRPYPGTGRYHHGAASARRVARGRCAVGVAEGISRVGGTRHGERCGCGGRPAGRGGGIRDSLVATDGQRGAASPAPRSVGRLSSCRCGIAQVCRSLVFRSAGSCWTAVLMLLLGAQTSLGARRRRRARRPRRRRTAAAPQGAELVRAYCSGCHHENAGQFERISSIRKTPEGWVMTLFRMRQVHGLQLEDGVRDALVRYLVRHAGSRARRSGGRALRARAASQCQGSR